jgi:hypothetical protein
MGTTPIYGFPYPDPSDLVANYPALGQQLAEDVETEIAASGKFVQLISATHSTEASTTGSTYVTTGITANITPLYNTSNILIIVSNPLQGNTNVSGTRVGLRLLRGGTTLVTNAKALYADYSVNSGDGGLTTQMFLDSPATTSSTTYVQHFANNTGAGGTTAFSCIGNETASMILIEVRP